MEYAQIITLSSETSVEKLSGIQYQALNIISRKKEVKYLILFFTIYLVYKLSIKDYMNYQENT